MQRILQLLPVRLRLCALYRGLLRQRVSADLWRRRVRSELRRLQQLPGGLRVRSLYAGMRVRRLSADLR